MYRQDALESDISCTLFTHTLYTHTYFQVAYFGSASEAMDYVASVGLRCTMHYNPADYLREYVLSHWTIAMNIISHACS